MQFWACLHFSGEKFMHLVFVFIQNFKNPFKYHIYRPIRSTFFSPKYSTCGLCAEGKYYFQTYKCLYIYYTTLL